ncbi:hypothetical protein [Tateyamaria sp.]|uniref:hypothetical protein n=1 Tax=Tateyamaria sp. TaxID=1929288 RepID=UPI00329D1EC6
METELSVPELIAAALANAETAKAQIAAIRSQMDGPNASEAQAADLRAAYVDLEWLAVDTFTLFERRMQHHFKRGPFSRKLKALLTEAGHTDLADKVHQYYLVTNVLKHGTGASYRELLNLPDALFPVKPTDPNHSEDEPAPSSLVDVDLPGFFEGLGATLIEASEFLESR